VKLIDADDAADAMPRDEPRKTFWGKKIMITLRLYVDLLGDELLA
jgi:hypothetical protein